MLLSIKTFVSDLILGSLWAFEPKMAILRGKVQKQFLGSAQVVEQLFFYVPSILTFDFDFFLVDFYFLGP